MKNRTKAVLFFLLFGLVLFSISFILNFPIVQNDFIGILTLVTFIDFTDFSSYYNGIYPIGYIFLIKVATILEIDPIIYATILNIITGTALAILLGKILKKKANSSLLLVSIFIISYNFFDPIYFKYLISPGVYSFFIFLLIAGFILFINGVRNESKSELIFAGVVLGFATLLRFHGVIFIAVILGTSFFHYKNKKQLLYVIAALMPFAFIHVYTNYLSTGTFMASNHKLMTLDVNWFELYPGYNFERVSITEYFKFYISNLSSRSYYLIPFVFYLSCKNYNSTFKFISIVSLLYYLLISLHPSERGVLPIIPLSYLTFFALISTSKISEKIRILQPISSFLMALVFTLVFLDIVVRPKIDFVRTIKSKMIKNTFVEEILHKESVYKMPRNVFTNDYGLYLPSHLPDIVYRNGGWMRLNKNTFSKYPNLDIISGQNFYQDLKNNDISFLVIDFDLLRNQILNYEQLESLMQFFQSSKLELLSEVNESYKIYKLN